MTFRLQDVPGWIEGTSCTPTALSAISGKPLDDMKRLLQCVTAARGEYIELERDGYAVDDWLAAVGRLGGQWQKVQDWRKHPVEKLMPIGQWIAHNPESALVLVHCDTKHLSSNEAVEGHVFATHRQEVVDTYTSGRIVDRPSPPSSWPDFRVKIVFAITA